MWIKSRRSNDARVVLAVLLAGSVALADSGSKASMPASVAGLKLEGLRLPGLHLSSREDRPLEEGGTVLRFADEGEQVRAVVRVAVAADHLGARRFLDFELSAISKHLIASTGSKHGEPAFTDDKETLIIAAVANLAYSVRLIDPAESAGLPSAQEIAAELRDRIVPGTPSFPLPAVSIPVEVDADEGARVRVDPQPGTDVRLRAEGGYIQAHPDGPVLRPFAPGPIVLIATSVDELGRVGVKRLELQAR
ncbi:MAG: hypothetical protein WBV82_10050 [Myxococcaceae bacterium]